MSARSNVKKTKKSQKFKKLRKLKNLKLLSLRGFNIVELIVVIVVIAIIAAITFVSYSNIRQKALASSLQSDLINASRQLSLDQIINNGYPLTLAALNGGSGFFNSPDTDYQYSVSNDTTPQTYCISATKDGVSYSVNQDGLPLAGVCPVLNLDANIIGSNAGNDTTWTDSSGEGNNGTLENGADYSDSNDGVINLDGVDDYVSVAPINAYSVGMWVKPTSSQPDANPTYYNQADQGTSEGYWWVYSVGSSTTINWKYTDGTSLKTVSWDNAISYDQWNYFVFIYNNSSKNVTLYKNGNSIGTKSCPNALMPSDSFYIGDYQGQANGYNLKGSINGFRVYDESLSSDEINKIFDTHRRRYDL